MPDPQAPNQPHSHDVELQVGHLLGWGRKSAAWANRWLLSNPEVSREEQEANLLRLLEEAKDPEDAAWAVLETVYNRMVVAWPTYWD